MSKKLLSFCLSLCILFVYRLQVEFLFLIFCFIDGFQICVMDSYVITPYNEYPQLLGLLLKLLNGELVWSTRREVLKVT